MFLDTRPTRGEEEGGAGLASVSLYGLPSLYGDDLAKSTGYSFNAQSRE